jgi:hypothetical protein
MENRNGSQSTNQTVCEKIAEHHRAFANFNDLYDYFGSNRLQETFVRAALKTRCWIQFAEFQLMFWQGCHKMARSAET